MTSALKWRLTFGLLLVFFAGGATGLFAGAWHARHAFVERHGGMMAERMKEHMRRQLNLTPEQTRDIDPILTDLAKRLQEIRRDSSRRVAETMEQSHRELATHLSPEQQSRFEEMKLRRQLRHWRRTGGRPQPPPPEDL
jgi:hypothetical protein